MSCEDDMLNGFIELDERGYIEFCERVNECAKQHNHKVPVTIRLSKDNYEQALKVLGQSGVDRLGIVEDV